MPWWNHAGTSWPKPAPILDAMSRFQALDPSRWEDRFEQDLATVRGHLAVEDARRFLPTPGCTSAIALGMASLDWQAGDAVVVDGLAHQALDGPVRALAGHGVERRVCRDLGELDAALEARSVRLVCWTAAANTTGAIAPIGAIVERAHAHDALVLIDAAQLAGWRLDLGALGADLVVFAGHKGPQTTWGIGGMIAGEAWPDLPGWCDSGSVDRAALAGLAAGLTWLAEPARADRLLQARNRVERLVQGVLALGGALVGPRQPTWRLPIAAFTFGKRSPESVGAALAARGVQVSAGRQCAPLAHHTLGTLPGGLVRFSAGPTTTDEHVTEALEALEEVLSP